MFNPRCTVENAKETLDLYGVAVIENVLNKEEVERIKSLAWQNIYDWSNGLIDGKDPTTWKNFSKFYPKHAMMIQEYGVGHMQWLWEVRQHMDVVKVFETLWGTNDLLTSFDAMSVHFPHETTGRGWNKGVKWHHTDANPKRKEMCIQGLVNLFPVNENDATLSVLEGSHKYHAEFFELFGRDVKGDWYKLANDEERNFFIKKGCVVRNIQAGEGSMVLWYSTTFHQGKEPERVREMPNIRLVSYVCMTPRYMATPEQLRKKRKALEDRRTTSHWPHRIKVFPLRPRTYGGPPPPATNEIPAPVLTEVGMRLAGY
jgi:hypothetical protein